MQCAPPGTSGLFWGAVLLKALIGCYVFLFSENDSRGSVPGLRLKDPLPLPHSLLLSIFFFLLLVSEFVSSPRRPSGSLATWLSSSLTQPKREKNKKKTSSSVLNSSTCRYVTREVQQLSERTAIGDSPRAVFRPSISELFSFFFFAVTFGPLRRSDDVSRASPVSPSLFPSALLFSWRPSIALHLIKSGSLRLRPSERWVCLTTC